MADRIRITLFDNSQPHLDGKAVVVSTRMSFPDFLSLASQKLTIPSPKKAFLANGGEVDDTSVLHANDHVYISKGEAFYQRRNAAAKESTPQYSIAVMGPGSVGKSAMTLRYVQGIFVMDYDPTIEDAYRKNAQVDGKPVMLDILDTAGQEDYTALRATWMRERDGFILVFSVNNRETFNDLSTFYELLQVMHDDDRTPPVLLVGNKADLPDRQVSAEEGAKLAQEIKAVAYLETSAKTGQNIDKAFVTLIRAMDNGNHVSSAQEERRRKKKSWCPIL